jgi:hypothetical protein
MALPIFYSGSLLIPRFLVQIGRVHFEIQERQLDAQSEVYQIACAAKIHPYWGTDSLRVTHGFFHELKKAAPPLYFRESSQPEVEIS